MENSLLWGICLRFGKSGSKADVLIYCVLMADACGLDMDEIVLEKMKRNNVKYPIEKAKDSAKKYDEL